MLVRAAKDPSAIVFFFPGVPVGNGSECEQCGMEAFSKRLRGAMSSGKGNKPVFLTEVPNGTTDLALEDDAALHESAGGEARRLRGIYPSRSRRSSRLLPQARPAQHLLLVSQRAARPFAFPARSARALGR